MRTTILRIPEETVLSEQLVQTLESTIGSYTLERVSKRPDTVVAVIDRIESIHRAFLLLIEAYPPKQLAQTTTNLEILKSYILANKPSNLSGQSFAHAHQQLEQFAELLIGSIKFGWFYGQKISEADKHAYDYLNDAEQYLIMNNGRSDITTLMEYDFGQGTEYLLQWDKSLSPCYEQLISDLDKVRRLDFPETPPWFLDFQEAEQLYIATQPQTVTPEELVQDLMALNNALKQANKDALNWDEDIRKVRDQEQPLPVWFENLNLPQKELVRLFSETSEALMVSTSSFLESLKQKKTNNLFAREVALVIALPTWYWVLQDHQQKLLSYSLNNSDSTETAISFLSSRQREIPAPANWGMHSIWRIDGLGETIVRLSDERYRSSHFVSRAMVRKHASEEVMDRHSTINLQQVMRYAKEGQLILFQTLISPLPFVNYLPKAVGTFISEWSPDAVLSAQAKKTIAETPVSNDMVVHNHPLNALKRYAFTTPANKNSLKLIEKITALLDSIALAEKEIGELDKAAELLKLEEIDETTKDERAVEVIDNVYILKAKREELCKALPSYYHKQEDTKELLSDYKMVLNSGIGSATYNDNAARELFLASLEHLLILSVDGYSYGSCVSGKDRKAIELMHTDSMIVYKARYGCYPKYSDTGEDRAQFVTIFAAIYLSLHQQELAGQNATGSRGIKTPYNYLPADICTEISRQLPEYSGDYLREENRLASDNEINCICTLEKIPKDNQIYSALIAHQLGEELCTKLYDRLYTLINEQRLFEVSMPKKTLLKIFDTKAPTEPTGITKIKRLMNDPEFSKSNVLKFAEIIQIVKDRPNDGGARSEETEKIYSRIRGLCDKEVVLNARGLKEYVDKVVGDWDELFSQAKDKNSQRAIFT